MTRRPLVRDVHPAAFWLAIGALWVAATAALCWSLLVLTGHTP